MSKRLLLTTAVGLILGTAAFAQTSTESSKNIDANKPAAQQTDKAKPMSRVEKWQADKQTEAAEKNIDKNTGTAANPTTTAQSPAPAATSNATQSQTPAANNNSADHAQNNPPASATKTVPNAGAPNAQPQNQQTQSNTPANTNQPATNQAQTPNAAPAANQNQQAQQPAQGNNNTANTNNTQTQTSISAGVSVTDPQRTRISESVTKMNVQPVTKVNFSVSIGTTVPRDVRLHTVPTEVVEIVPQYRDYKFFLVREEIVIVEPSTMKIVTVLPRNGGTTASTTTSTQTSSTKTRSRTTNLSDSDRTTIKKNAAKPRQERTTTTRIERDDPRTARAESRRELRVGDRVPASIELYEMPERAYRDAPTLREYRYMSRGSRTYVIEPRERTIIEELD